MTRTGIYVCQDLNASSAGERMNSVHGVEDDADSDVTHLLYRSGATTDHGRSPPARMAA